jgi:hypothetical protein
MTDPRHRAVQIVFVETPSAGCPEPHRHVKPGQYKRNPPTHWNPRTKPPSKAAASASLLRRIVENEAMVRQMLRPRPQP